MSVIKRTNRYISGFSTVNVESTRKKTFKRYDEEAIKRDLLNRFMTRKGERLMLPNYGSIVWNLLMEPVSDAVKDQIAQDCIDQIAADGRVDLVQMNLQELTQGYYVEMILKYLPFDKTGEFALIFERNDTI